MCCGATGWKAGAKVWEISHESEKGIYHLSQIGDIPAEFAAIYERHKAEQDSNGGEESDVDYIFEIPVELAKAITSFRHDEDPDYGGDDPWKVCEILRSTNQGASKQKPGCLPLLLTGGALASAAYLIHSNIT